MLRLVVRLAIRLVAVASLLAGCRISLENSDETTGDGGVQQCVVSTTSHPCMDAAGMMHPPLTWIESKIFTVSGNFPGCHSSPTDAGKLDLRMGTSHDHLINVSSMVDRTRKLVVPN